MRFMNDCDIETAAARWQDHPILGPASATLESLQNGADSCSDGWCYWRAPAAAAGQLMQLIEGDRDPDGPRCEDCHAGGHARHLAYCKRPDATTARLKSAYSQLRRFRTRHPQCSFRIHPAPDVPGDPAPPAPPRQVPVIVGRREGDLSPWLIVATADGQPLPPGTYRGVVTEQLGE